jgi:hypothetical protein
MFDTLVTKYAMNLRKELFLDADGDVGIENASTKDEMLPFLIVVDQGSIEGLLVVMKLRHLWTFEPHLRELFDIVKAEKWTEGMTFIA